MKSMRIAVLATSLALGAWGSQGALAAPLTAPTYDWTGGYLGAFAGYGWGQTAAGTTYLWEDSDTTNLYASLPGFNFNGGGLLGGVETGVGTQTGGLYWGLEADVAAAGIKGTYTDDDAGFSIDSNVQWLSTLRARIGVPIDRFLVFGTGGLAIGGVQASLHDVYGGGATTLTTSNSRTGVGWSIGAGVAAALNGGWSIKAEYLYVDLGTQNYAFAEDPSGTTGFPMITGSSRNTASILRFALDYKY